MALTLMDQGRVVSEKIAPAGSQIVYMDKEVFFIVSTQKRILRENPFNSTQR
jgi:hypothetical protein